MGILKSIFSKIFPPSHPVHDQPVEGTIPGASQQGATPGASQQGAVSGSSLQGQPAGAAPESASPSTSQQSTAVGGAPPIAAEPVDVEAILNDRARKLWQPLNWRTSIVDLLKLLDLDNSLQARKELARELHYVGDTNDTAAMNIWLHRQVMVKLAANGGKLPPDLRT